MNRKKSSRGRLWQDLKILLMLVLIAAARIGITLLRGGRAALGQRIQGGGFPPGLF